MRMVLLGGAPGVGKTTTAGALLDLAGGGDTLVQWVEVDALWRHQPWRVDEASTGMLRANLRAVLAHGSEAGIEVALVTWVFQDAAVHELLRRSAPGGTAVTTVQLHLAEEAWHRRVLADTARPSGLHDFFRERYEQAQRTPVDHVVDVDGLPPDRVARVVADVIGLAVR